MAFASEPAPRPTSGLLPTLTPEELLAGLLAEQRHQLLDPAEPPVSAAGRVAA